MKQRIFLGAGLLAAAGLTAAVQLGGPARSATADSAGEERGSATLLTTTRIASGLTLPVELTHAPGDFNRLFVLEKRGVIRVIRNGVLLATPFLDIDALVGGGTSSFDERGLLGLAFHPNFQQNGVFYVNYTNNSTQTTIASYRVNNPNDDTALPGSATTHLIISQPFSNHNGGTIRFGPDGFLYIGMGDGGSRCDPSDNAQNLNSLLGKMLRIDVDGADNIPGNGDDDGFPADANRLYTIPATNPYAGGGGAPEIWTWGLRNPWKFAFDRLTGDMNLPDVGQDLQEEINFESAGTGSNRNYGWDCNEGTLCASLSPSSCTSTRCVCNQGGFTAPIFTYNHAGSSRCSITGGYTYRGCAIPDLLGTYFYADFCTNEIFTIDVVGGAAVNFTNRTAELAPGGGLSIASITSFGEDAFGEMYIVDQGGGEIFKIVPRSFVGPDCNANAQRDACDILSGASTDNNSNGVPDECDPNPCPADLDGDGQVGSSDLASLLGSWGAGGPADFDGGGVGSSDLAFLLGSWGPCP